MTTRDIIDETLSPSDWTTFSKATILTQNEVDKLLAIDSYARDPILLVQQVESLGVSEYATVIQNVIGRVSDHKHTHRLLHILRILLTSSPKFADAYCSNGDPYPGLRAHIHKDDLPLTFNLFACLGIVIERNYSSDLAVTTLKDVLEYLTQGISDAKGRGAYICLSSIRALTNILQRREIRRTFVNENGPYKLFKVLQTYNMDSQLVYETTFCFWLMTYYLSLDRNIFSDMNLIPTLHQSLKSMRDTEKVVRITLMTLCNLLKDSRFSKEFISVGGPKTFLSLSKKSYEDKDINDLVLVLLKATEDSIDELSTFDEYRQEVLSGALVASPAHDSEKFWKQNIDRFEEGEYKLVNSLLALCKGSSFKVQTIALKDIGNFVIYHPDGRGVIAELGGKGVVMSLMESSDEDVRSQALNCTQKIMLQNWAYIQ